MDTDSIKKILNKREADNLSPLAALSISAERFYKEHSLEDGYRQTFSVDADRILHSLAYTRYIDKTQVFYLVENDHITHRVLHVQLVSKIARTIGRFLGFNEDLIEAIALGHDIGHSPFGHDGESFLSELCKANNIGHFSHSVQSVQFLEKVERKGRGWNLTLQTLDGILCHDGETHSRTLKPEREKTFATLRKEMTDKKLNPAIKLIPMTMEGCVVRMADTISYIGRDIEDAIRLNLIKRSYLPANCVKFLGDTNGTIVFNLTTDIIKTSFGKDYIAFSSEISKALKELKDFNMQNIYTNPLIKDKTKFIKQNFKILFAKYLDHLEKENKNSVIFTGFLKNMSKEYIENHRKEEIVRDFIAGMTDKYFLRQCK